MRGLARFLLLSVMGTSFWGCAGLGGSAGRMVGDEQLGKVGLQYYWNRTLALGDGEKLQQVWRLDENAYCLTSRNRLYVIEAANGLPKWDYSGFNPDSTVFAPSHANNVIFSPKVAGIRDMDVSSRTIGASAPFDIVTFNTLTQMVTFDRKTGKIVRELTFDFSASTSGCTDGVYYYIGATTGRYFVYRLYDDVKVWWGQTEGKITAPPVVHSSRLYVASTDGTMDAMLVGDTARRIWQSDDRASVKMRGPVAAAFHVDDRGCFVPCGDNRIYAFELASGRPLWEPFSCEGPLRSPIQVSKSTIFEYASSDKFYAINLTNGKLRWTLPEGRRVLGVMKGNDYVLAGNGTVLVVDEVLGQVKGSVDLTGLDILVSNTSAPAIYAASENGEVACIRLKAAGHLTADMLKTGMKLDKAD